MCGGDLVIKLEANGQVFGPCKRGREILKNSVYCRPKNDDDDNVFQRPASTRDGLNEGVKGSVKAQVTFIIEIMLLRCTKNRMIC